MEDGIDKADREVPTKPRTEKQEQKKSADKMKIRYTAIARNHEAGSEEELPIAKAKEYIGRGIAIEVKPKK